MIDIVERLRARGWGVNAESAREAADTIERLRVETWHQPRISDLRDEIERLTLENWQLKGALGYPVPGNIPQGPFKCGLCEARALEPKP